MSESIISPCIGICSYNSEGNCIGCYRSSEEIVKWFDMTNEERATIMKELNKRAESSFD